MTNEEKINLIGQKIFILSNNLDKYQTELQQLKQQLEELQAQSHNLKPIVPDAIITREPIIQTPPTVVNQIIPETKPEVKKEQPVVNTAQPIVSPIQQQYVPPVPPKIKREPAFNFEEFIGGKLISIIGIVVLVIGLGIGVKYAIDQGLINPLMRVVLAYAAGGILLLIAFRLKEKFKSFSAVLLSGAMASLYFTTFAAFSVYGLLPREMTFALMLIFTAFTVYAAIIYSLEVIGVIGLVGAYAVPMLLSDGTGRIEIMFSYMLIINTGILILSFKKYWQVLNHIAFALSWLIVGAWIVGKYNYETQAIMVLTFCFLFFIIFYISNMAYKIIKHEKFGVIDIVRLLSNSFIFFGIGYYILNNELYRDYLGLFTLANAIIHFIFSYIVFKNKLLDRNLFYLLIAMVLTFITIAVPVQLEGNWVTLIWSSEAALLFIIGRYKQVRFYEWLGIIMIVLSLVSLANDWGNSYYDSSIYKFWVPVTNIYFFTSIFFIASLSSIIYVHHKKSLTTEERSRFQIYSLIDYALPVLLFIITYVTFSNEINTFFKAKFEQSYLKAPSHDGDIETFDYSINHFQNVAIHIYNFIFLSIVTVIAIRKWDNNTVRWTVLGFNLFIALFFLVTGLDELSTLRSGYLSPESSYYPQSSWAINIRYICILLLGILLYLTHLLLKTETFKKTSLQKMYVGCIIHFFILVILSVEIININVLHNYGIESSYYHGTKTAYKLGFTSLWGIYSFMLIAWGIFKRNRIMRVSAITLFGITLLKLVTFDTWDLSTGYKIIAFILLGVILLVVAFLYQKFKLLIFGNDEQEEELKNESQQ